MLATARQRYGGRVATRVFVVDDNQQIRRMLSQILSLDFDVVGVAADGTEAIEGVTDLEPDVVIVDYMMPGIDGIETARVIRANRPEQPILLYTAFLDGDIEAKARDAGVFECVTKLDGPVALERAIRRIAGEQLF